MEPTSFITELDDDDLREFCLVGIFHLAHANWVNGVDDDVWSDVLEEAYQRGWTDMHIVFEKASVN
ncbi:hypothetical protein [Ensifer sp. 1H6]|uniref:hypothetical protein n=1 Tax=Ensifer sp. 1H6 TaxID=1911585 RepID=UPI0009D40F85|nr:hypothetical protein [Ensifer sp. 1H6]OMQ42095.1 hypothetical protein BKP54_25495 [Ensifer sp. 1H6]